jgi:hypothetical protein
MPKTIEQESLSFEPSAEMNFGAVYFSWIVDSIPG